MNAIDFQNGLVMGLCANGRTLRELEVSEKSDTIYGIWYEELHTSYHEEIGLFLAECKNIEAIQKMQNGTYLFNNYMDNTSVEVLVASVPEEGIMITTNLQDEEAFYGIMLYMDKYYFFDPQQEEKTYNFLLYRKTGDVEDYVFYSENTLSQPITCIKLTNGFTITDDIKITIKVEDEEPCIRNFPISYFEGINGYLEFYHWGGDITIPSLSEDLKKNRNVCIEIFQEKPDKTFVKKIIGGTPTFPTKNFNYFVWGNETLFPLSD